jgi:hypothetical protein
MRLARQLAQACRSATIVPLAPSPTRFEATVAGKRPLDPAVLEYAHGFAKGAATRLNEGERPVLRASTAAGGRSWTVTVEWGTPGAAEAAATREGKRPRR